MVSCRDQPFASLESHLDVIPVNEITRASCPVGKEPEVQKGPYISEKMKAEGVTTECKRGSNSQVGTADYMSFFQGHAQFVLVGCACDAFTTEMFETSDLKQPHHGAAHVQATINASDPMVFRARREPRRFIASPQVKRTASAICTTVFQHSYI